MIPLCWLDMMQVLEGGATSYIAVQRQAKNYSQLAPVSSTTFLYIFLKDEFH